MTKVLMSFACVFLAGCMDIGEARNTNQHLIIDNSGSLDEVVSEHIQGRVLGEVDRWTKSAMPGDCLMIWWFSEEGSSFPADSYKLEMPALVPPAHLHRLELSKGYFEEIQLVLGGIPPHIAVTPLLETLYFIASNQNHPYSIILYSDLAQDTPRWNNERRRYEGEDLLELMQEYCPSVTHYPTKVDLVSWPGKSGGPQASIYEHVENRDLWKRFISAWSPSIVVETQALR